MGRITVDSGMPANPAKASLILKAVYFTEAGANVAGLQAEEGLAGALFQNFQGREVIAGQEKTTKYFEGGSVMSFSGIFRFKANFQ
jgi:hypothetical protein